MVKPFGTQIDYTCLNNDTKSMYTSGLRLDLSGLDLSQLGVCDHGASLKVGA